ncbi:MAG: PilZ domain-containing protein [Myxococcota bacterium]|nr:PilZ domain-containing protein [Myxococcota bacterium]MDW8361888.1 PilZ domain-containing protein [Myxococcales bacterium]
MAGSREERGTGSRREQERVTINKEFESFDAFIHEYVTNISRSGAFVKSKQPLPVGTRVNLRFTVIMDDIETIEGIGEVVRVETDPPGMGVVFRELSQYSKHLIERLLTAQPSSGSRDPTP